MLLTLLSLALADSTQDTDTSAPQESDSPADTSVYVDTNAKAELVYTQETGCTSFSGRAVGLGAGAAMIGLLIFPAARRKPR